PQPVRQDHEIGGQDGPDDAVGQGQEAEAARHRLGPGRRLGGGEPGDGRTLLDGGEAGGEKGGEKSAGLERGHRGAPPPAPAARAGRRAICCSIVSTSSCIRPRRTRSTSRQTNSRVKATAQTAKTRAISGSRPPPPETLRTLGCRPRHHSTDL